MLSAEEQFQFAALVATVNALADRIASLESARGESARPNHALRQRYSGEDLERLAIELTLFARQCDGNLPSDGQIAQRLGVRRGTLNRWFRDASHPVGRVFAALARVGTFDRLRKGSPRSSKSRIASDRRRHDELDD